jgi:hypothetical protein
VQTELPGDGPRPRRLQIQISRSIKVVAPVAIPEAKLSIAAAMRLACVNAGYLTRAYEIVSLPAPEIAR